MNLRLGRIHFSFPRRDPLHQNETWTQGTVGTHQDSDRLLISKTFVGQAKMVTRRAARPPFRTSHNDNRADIPTVYRAVEEAAVS